MTRVAHNSVRAAGLLLLALGCMAIVGAGGTSLSALLGGNTLGDLLGTGADNQSGSQTASGQGTGNQTGGTSNNGTGNGGAGGQVSLVGQWDVMFTAVAIAADDAGINEGDQRPGTWTFTDNGDGTVKLTSSDGSLDGRWSGSSYYFEAQFNTFTLSTGQGYTTYKSECFPRDSTSMYGTMEMDYVFQNYTTGLIPQGHDAYPFEATRRRQPRSCWSRLDLRGWHATGSSCRWPVMRRPLRRPRLACDSCGPFG